MPSCATMSSVTSWVAVAVKASTGTPLKRFFRPARLRYAGLKSWPHWLMQWASSTAIKESGTSRRAQPAEASSPSGAA